MDYQVFVISRMREAYDRTVQLRRMHARMPATPRRLPHLSNGSQRRGPSSAGTRG
jgi:hypothetical protein